MNNEYTYELWGKLKNTFVNNDKWEFSSTRCIIAKDCVEALAKAEKTTESYSTFMDYQVRNFRKL